VTSVPVLPAWERTPLLSGLECSCLSRENYSRHVLGALCFAVLPCASQCYLRRADLGLALTLHASSPLCELALVRLLTYALLVSMEVRAGQQ